MNSRQLGVWLLAGMWFTVAAVAAAGEGGTRVDVGGVHVDVGAKMQPATPPVRVRDIIGLKVLDPNQESLGKIEDLVIDPSAGKIRYAVLSFGGFLGMGDKLFAVPWNDLGLVSKGTTSAGTVKEDHYVLNLSKEALKSAPGFDKNRWPDFADRNFIASIERFYSDQRAASAGGTRRR